MNHNWLPSLAKKYGAQLCDQRALWKAYLREHHLEPRALLRDNVHLNEHGEWFMAECVKAYLRYDPKLGPSPADGWVKTFEVGKDVPWADCMSTYRILLHVPFRGRPGWGGSLIFIANLESGDSSEISRSSRSGDRPSRSHTPGKRIALTEYRVIHL